MGAAIEHVDAPCSVIRAGPEHEHYGDPYTVAATVIWETPERVRVVGAVSGGALLRERSAIRDVLRSLGARHVMIERRGRRTTTWDLGCD